MKFALVTVALVFSTSAAAAAGAMVAAFTLGYIAHFELGFSRQKIRTPAMIAAAVIALLLAVEFFGKKLGKSK
jgi:hypothetical protein